MTLEELLNKLMELGYKPFGYSCGKFGYNNIEFANNQIVFSFGERSGKFVLGYSIRELVSKESGLWQFVCENGKVIEKENEIKMGDDIHSYDYISVEYRLIESALKDESELEQFLLDNIKIEG